ncbi:MAG: T9SS type A sorting domain-containing protein [bacterium]|nr:T9SS type A sorting domain-containing protein [bacterium]
MKNTIKFIFILCLTAAGIPLLAQEQTTELDNGRPAGMTSKPVQKSDLPTYDRSHENSNQDWDVHRNLPKQEEQTMVYPQDILVLQDELFNTSSRQEVVEQLEAMKALLRQLQAGQEALKRENEIFRRSLAACCAADETGLGVKDAYLLQNAPNPFINNTRIEYFVPRNLGNAVIELRDIKGALIASYPVRPGNSSLNIDRNNLDAGSYLYALVVDGKMVDTKVMIFKP